MSVIRFALDGQKLVLVEAPTIASQGILEDSVVFDFSAEWNGAGKVALFWRKEDEQREDVYRVSVDENNSATVPWEVTQTDGEIGITVFGVRDSTIITADIYYYKIVEGLYTEGSGSQPPTPDIYQQILAIAGEVNGKFEDCEDMIDVIDARVDNIVAQNTTGMLSGFTIQTIEAENIVLSSQGGGNFYASPSDYPFLNSDFILLFIQGIYDITSRTEYSATDAKSGVWHIKNSDEYWFIYQNPMWPDDTVTLRAIILVPFTQNLTELTDIRVAADSTTYQSAGAAVRAQVDDLQEQIDELRG